MPFRLTDVAEIYSIRIEGKENSEIQEFIITFKDIPDKYLKDDFDGIIRNLIKISEKGAAESMFRPEGKIRDRVCALPLYTVPREKCKHGVLRLYCIRLSENLIIVGGGGEKSTRTYEEDKDRPEQYHDTDSITWLQFIIQTPFLTKFRHRSQKKSAEGQI